MWFGGGERGKDLFLRFPSKHFWEVRPAGMIDRPKEARLDGKRWEHAMEREREHLRHGRRKCHGGLRNNTNLPLSGEGKWYTDELLGGRQVRPVQTKAIKG